MSASGDPLAVEAREAADGAVLALSGDLVITSVDRLVRAVGERVEGGAARVVVEATDLAHVDTAGFAAVVRLAGRCAEAGVAFVLAGLPVRFAALASALRLEEAVTMADSVEEALGGRPD